MSSSRVRKNLLGSTVPQTLSKEVRDLTEPDYYGKINHSPPYQRDIKWTPDSMNEFIGTVMDNGLVQPVTVYQLHPEDKIKESKYNYEVIDGKHRMHALYAFKTSSRQLTKRKKEYIVHWCYEETDESGGKHIQRVFYQESDDVKQWYHDTYPDGGSPSFLDQDEKDVFDNFTISFTMIRAKLTMDQRRVNFLSLQKGLPVRKADYLKNMTVCKLIASFAENGYEEMMMSVFFPHCSKKASNYWTQWAARLFLHFKQSKLDEPKHVEAFLKKDTAIKNDIKKNDSVLNPTSEEFAEFHVKFCEFIGFLKDLDECIKLNPTQMFSLFAHLCSKDAEVDVIATHMKRFSKDGMKKDNKGLWESSNHERRKDYFNECLTELKSMKKIVPRQTPSNELKNQVFAKAKVSGSCDICGSKISIDKFHCGHIIAHVKYGLLELDNLIPLCVTCNLKMGTHDPDYYKANIMPYN